MKILITGASGFIGSALAQRLIAAGHEVHGWQHRRALPAEVQPIRQPTQLSGHYDVLVNLAGASIAGGLWSEKRRATLRRSRIDFTRSLLAQLGQNDFSVGHLISGSAIGYYGPGTQAVDEDSAAGDDFSAQLTRDWEAAAVAAKSQVETLSLVRTGLVLGRDGGLLPTLARPARFGLAARLGDGQQGQSWIHLHDWLAALDWIIAHRLDGPVNVTAPQPVSQDAFNRALTEALHRPYWLRMPAGPLRWTLGDLSTLLLDGQYVLPKRLLDSGFQFAQPTLAHALTQLFPAER